MDTFYEQDGYDPGKYGPGYGSGPTTSHFSGGQVLALPHWNAGSPPPLPTLWPVASGVSTGPRLQWLQGVINGNEEPVQKGHVLWLMQLLHAVRQGKDRAKDLETLQHARKALHCVHDLVAKTLYLDVLGPHIQVDTLCDDSVLFQDDLLVPLLAIVRALVLHGHLSTKGIMALLARLPHLVKTQGGCPAIAAALLEVLVVAAPLAAGASLVPLEKNIDLLAAVHCTEPYIQALVKETQSMFL